MKVRTALISIVVSAALVGSAGYGAYYAMQRKKSPVDVVPVANVNMGYYSWDQQETLYGTVTSQVAQTVRLNDEYPIEKIFVKEGDKVKEGTPLFSYDMTMQELELEMQQLELQTNELTMTRLEKELEKLKRTPTSASLVRELTTLTAAAEAAGPTEGTEPPVQAGTPVSTPESQGNTGAPMTVSAPEPQESTGVPMTVSTTEPQESAGSPMTVSAPEPQENMDVPEPLQDSSGNADMQTPVQAAPENGGDMILDEGQDSAGSDILGDPADNGGSTAPGPSENAGGTNGSENSQEPQFELDGVEQVERTEEEILRDAVNSSVLRYEELVLAIQAYFDSCGDQLKDDKAEESMQEAVSYYRKNLAEEKIIQEPQADGTVKEIRTYEILESVRQVLGEETLQRLTATTAMLDQCLVTYVQMLISEAGTLEEAALPEAVRKIQGMYGLLDVQQQPQIGDEYLQQLETLIQEYGTDTVDSTQQTGDSQQETGETGSGDDPADGQTPEGGETLPDVRKNPVTFQVAEGAAVTVGQTDIAQNNMTAMAENGTIVFSVAVQEGYEIADVLVNNTAPAAKYEATPEENDYIIENIQTDDTVVTVTTRPAGSVTTHPVTFQVAEGAVVTVGQVDVAQTNLTAMAENGTIVFSVAAQEGYEIADVLVNNVAPAAKNEATPEENDYIIENIQTDDTVVTVTTRPAGTPGTETEVTPGTETEVIPGTETEAIPGAEIQTEPATETESVTEPQTQTESETRAKYTLTIKYPALDVQQHYEGDTVTIQADMGDVTLEFLGWKLEPLPETMTEEDLRSDRITFVMPPFDLTAEAQYQNAPDAIEGYVQNFLAVAEELLADGAEQSFAAQGRDYLTELENATVFYQQWLAVLPAEILDGTSGEVPELQKYQLKKNVRAYLKEQEKDALIQQLKDDYKELCLLYAKKLFLDLDPADLDKDKLSRATEIYNILGDKWREALEKRWQEENTVQTDETDEYGEPIAPTAVPGIGDTLAAYGVLSMFQDYQKLSPEISDDERYMALQNIWNAFLGLSEEQQAIVGSTDPLFEETLRAYGLWEDLEPETEPYFDGGWGDLGGWGDEPLYTAQELQDMIWDKEQEIKSCELDIRQSELDLKQKQRILDEKVVKSTLEGTVLSIGDEAGNSEEDYFVKVANEAGLYAKGSMSELALEKLKVGDMISGKLMTNGTDFTAEIKEISEYPDSGGSMSYGYGSGNSNASYYPFYALIEDTTDMEEGDAEIYLTATAPDMDNSIYLENYFVRSESDGRAYVYKEGDDGNLTKQYVTTGNKMGGYAVQIIQGLDLTDHIAFPYGKDVTEGAKTREVDALQYEYM